MHIILYYMYNFIVAHYNAFPPRLCIQYNVRKDVKGDHVTDPYINQLIIIETCMTSI